MTTNQTDQFITCKYRIVRYNGKRRTVVDSSTCATYELSYQILLNIYDNEICRVNQSVSDPNDYSFQVVRNSGEVIDYVIERYLPFSTMSLN